MNHTHDEEAKNLGVYICKLRTERGFSIRGLATAAGVDSTWLSKLERGVYSTPDPRHLHQLARTLEVDVADLFLAAGYQGGESLPALAPYLRAKYDLPDEAVTQLAAHFELLHDKYDDEQRGKT